jgi:hypothetical protein
MVQRSLVTVLPALGGILIIVGGLLGALLSAAPLHGQMPFYGSWNAVILGVLAVIFGLVILAYSGATHFGSLPGGLAGGVVLLVLGVITWVVVGAWLLVAIGSFLTIVAGLLLLAEVLFAGSGSRSNRST